MKKIVCVMLTITLLSACKNNQQPEAQSITAAVVDPQKQAIDRGKYLVTAIGCTDCHSPKKLTAQGPIPDDSRFLSGFDASEPMPDFDFKEVKKGNLIFNGQLTAFAGPWGVSFAANLTPDPTGLGSWSLAQFKKAIREGKIKGLDNSRMILPPMPWPNFAKLTDADLEAIFAYLKTIKPVKNVVPAPLPPKA